MNTSTSRVAKSPQFDSVCQEAYLNLWRTYDRLKAVEDEMFAAYDLSAQQYNALRLLAAAHPGTMRTLTLGARLISRAPDMTRMLDRLEDRQLVHRERKAENRRVVEVGITDGGLKLLEQLAGPVRDCHMRQLGHLPPKVLKQLIELLVSVRYPHEEEESVWRKP